MEEITTEFQDVLSGGNDRISLLLEAIEQLSIDKFIEVEDIYTIISSSDSGFVSKNFLKIAFNALTKEGFLLIKDRTKYKLVGGEDERRHKFIEKTFGEKNEATPEMKEHFEKYGFLELVNSVSKQINHENILVKEYDFDRLMIGRYIDFLMKARSYISWFKADQSIAKKKLRELEKSKK